MYKKIEAVNHSHLVYLHNLKQEKQAKHSQQVIIVHTEVSVPVVLYNALIF